MTGIDQGKRTHWYRITYSGHLAHVECDSIEVSEIVPGLVLLSYVGLKRNGDVPIIVNSDRLSIVHVCNRELDPDPYSQESLKKAWAGGDEGEFTSADTLIYRSDEPTYYHMYTGCDDGTTMHNERVIRRGSQ